MAFSAIGWCSLEDAADVARGAFGAGMGAGQWKTGTQVIKTDSSWTPRLPGSHRQRFACGAFGPWIIRGLGRRDQRTPCRNRQYGSYQRQTKRYGKTL
jgi:hypothetical protein